MAPTIESYRTRLRSIPGALEAVDAHVLEQVSELQTNKGVKGDVLEIGVYQGRAAILLGFLLEPTERLHLCDPFTMPSTDNPDFLTGSSGWYQPFSREAVEANYLRFHDEPPQFHVCSSLELEDRLQPNTFRLIHLDGSHDRDTIRADIALTKELLVEGGVISFFGYRTMATLEVAAAVWEEIGRSTLEPVCATRSHLYASWSPYPLIDSADLIARLEGIPSAAVAIPPFDGITVPLVQLPRPQGVKSFIPPVLWPKAREIRETVRRRRRP